MSSEWWDGYPWRLIQTNLREIDMRDIDADQYVSDLRSFEATIAMINTSGIIASYSTDIPYHYQSPYLEGDSLETIIEACHDAEIKVVARTDFSKVRRPIYESHPEWAYVSAEGQIMEYNGDVSCCLNGAYQQEHCLDIIRETLEVLDVDGMFFNMAGYRTRDYSGTYYGICHCRNCQTRFREMYDHALPGEEDIEDPVYRDYHEFQRRTVAEHESMVNAFIQDIRPDLCIANHLNSGRGFVRRESNTAIERPLPHWQYDAAETVRWVVASYPDMVPSNTTVDFIDFPYRHVSVSPAQQALRLIQSLATGGGLDYYLIGRLDNHEDRSGFSAIREIFQYHAAHEAAYRDLESTASIALLTGPGANRREERGWYRVLVEHHFSFDVQRVDAADPLGWERYDHLILPDYQPVSDELAARVDAYVQDGGTLVTCGETGTRTERHDPRDGPAIASLGIDEVHRVRDDMTSSYLRVTDDLPGFEDRDLVYLLGPYVYPAYASDVETHLQLIPPHNFGPPERCYYETVTDHPGYVTRPVGDGLVVYLPWKPGQLFYRQGHTNTAEFLHSILTSVAGAPTIRTNASPMVEITHMREPSGDADMIHLVNTSGHFGNSFYSPVPIRDIAVTVERAERPQRCLSLVDDSEREYTWDAGELTIEVSSVGAFEAIRVT